MEGFVDQNEEFKIPQAMFIKELESVESLKYAHSNSEAISRMSLFNQFDPLVANHRSPQQLQSLPEGDGSPENGNADQQQVVNKENGDHETSKPNCKVVDDLIQVNTPKLDHIHTNGNKQVDDSQIYELFGQLLYFNKQTVELCLDLKNQLAEKNENINKQLAEKNETIDNLESQLYDLHAKYDSLRKASKEYSTNTESLYNQKLQEKTEECRKWMLAAGTMSKENQELHRLVQSFTSPPE